MKLGEIYKFLDALSPFELQEKWDNSGLQVGSLDTEVKHLHVSLDVDSFMLESLHPNTLIITHHPLIFKGLKNFNPDFYPASLLQKMIEKNISLIAMHTNFDKTHLNEYVAKEVLKLEIISKEEFFCHVKVKQDFDSFVTLVKKALGLLHVKTVKSCDFIQTATLTTGSGGDFIEHLSSDCFLTGDVKYHQALLAKENGLSIIDIGHYESECFFVEAMTMYLKNFPLKAIISNSKNPFTYY